MSFVAFNLVSARLSNGACSERHSREFCFCGRRTYRRGNSPREHSERCKALGRCSLGRRGADQRTAAPPKTLFGGPRKSADFKSCCEALTLLLRRPPPCVWNLANLEKATKHHTTATVVVVLLTYRRNESDMALSLLKLVERIVERHRRYEHARNAGAELRHGSPFVRIDVDQALRQRVTRGRVLR